MHLRPAKFKSHNNIIIIYNLNSEEKLDSLPKVVGSPAGQSVVKVPGGDRRVERPGNFIFKNVKILKISLQLFSLEYRKAEMFFSSELRSMKIKLSIAKAMFCEVLFNFFNDNNLFLHRSHLKKPAPNPIDLTYKSEKAKIGENFFRAGHFRYFFNIFNNKKDCLHFYQVHLTRSGLFK